MKIEWYTYGPGTKRTSGIAMRQELPVSIRDRLWKNEIFKEGVFADPNDSVLLRDLDQFFGVWTSKEYIRWLNAEVDRTSVGEYSHYLISLIDMKPVNPDSDRSCARKMEDLVGSVKMFKWPRLEIGIRELPTIIDEPFDRFIVLTSQTMDIFNSEDVTGLDYTSAGSNLFLARVLKRTRCIADDIFAPDFDDANQSVCGPYEFGLRYEAQDFGPEDLHILDRVEVGGRRYRYRLPWLVASSHFVEVCQKHKIDRLTSTNMCYSRGFSAVLVGKGRVTSSVLR